MQLTQELANKADNAEALDAKAYATGLRDACEKLRAIETKRILPGYRFVLGQEMQEAVGQAIGAASVCWSETPNGEFDSTRAKRIADELQRIIVKYAIAYPDELRKLGPLT